MDQEVERRMSRLERKNKRLGWVAGTTILLLVVGFALGAADEQETPEELKTRKLSVVGKEGKNGASLFVSDGGDVTFMLWDKNEKVRVSLFLLPDGSPRLLMRDSNEKLRLIMFLDNHDGSARISIVDESGGETYHAPPNQ